MLLDSGSGASFITENLVSHLHLQRFPARNTFSGADGDFICTQKVKVELSPVNDESTSINTECYVVSKIPMSTIPSNHSQIVGDPVVKDLTLADPDLGGPIDIILGNKGRRQCVLSRTQTFGAGSKTMCPKPICRTQTFGAGSDQDNLWLDGAGSTIQ